MWLGIFAIGTLLVIALIIIGLIEFYPILISYSLIKILALSLGGLILLGILILLGYLVLKLILSLGGHIEYDIMDF